MAKQRQKGLGEGGGKAFTVRTSHEIYKAIDDYAWERRLTFAAAVSYLLLNALSTEIGGIENGKKITKAN